MASFTTPTYPGVNIEDDYGPQINAIGVAFICISFVAVVLRFISRKTSDIPIKLDDWLAFLAGVSYLM
jgi:hypothetical protein